MQLTETAPVLKVVSPTNFFFYRTEITIDQWASVQPVCEELFKEAARHALKISGPMEWHYFWFSVDKPFTLEASIPVEKVLTGYDGPFHFKRANAFTCISLIHEGEWSLLGSSYAKVNTFAKEQGLSLTDMAREVYLNADQVHPELNVTEIQVGIS